MTDLKQVCDSFAIKENCILGICDASPLQYPAKGFTPFVSCDILKRTDPTANLSGAKSIIVVGVESKIRASSSGLDASSSGKSFSAKPKSVGVLSVLGATTDYHPIIKALLKKLIDELKNTYNFSYKILVDSGTLDERQLAIKAGLGFIGNNGLVISSEYGSRFNIGILLTDIPLKKFYPTSDNNPTSCKIPIACCPHNCNKCITACPTNALTGSGGINASRCISYLTQKDDLTIEDATLIGNHLYGCDICQDICPFNNPQPVACADPKCWLAMSDADFASVYGHTAMLWRGAALLRRNAKIVLQNSYKNDVIF